MSNNYKIQCLVPDLPGVQDIIPYLEEMHSNRWYSNFGPLVKRFEAEVFSIMPGLEVGSNHGYRAVSFSSATMALEIALRAKNYPAGAKVLVPALTFPATALVVVNAGLTPIMCDVEEGSWCLNAAHATEIVSQNPDICAVIPVAAFGRPFDLADWSMFQVQTGVDVIADAAAVLGQQELHHGVDIVFSLHATKPFGVGEGGLLITSDRSFEEKVRALSNFGFSPRGTGEVQAAGTNGKMGEYYAAVGLAQLRRFQEVMGRRQEVLDCYLEQLVPVRDKINLQLDIPGFVPAVFCIDIGQPVDPLCEAFEREKIHHRRWYIPPLHKHPVFASYPIWQGEGQIGLPLAERLGKSLIGLPFHAFLTKEDVAAICRVIVKVLGN